MTTQTAEQLEADILDAANALPSKKAQEFLRTIGVEVREGERDLAAETGQIRELAGWLADRGVTFSAGAEPMTMTDGQLRMAEGFERALARLLERASPADTLALLRLAGLESVRLDARDFAGEAKTIRAKSEIWAALLSVTGTDSLERAQQTLSEWHASHVATFIVKAQIADQREAQDLEELGRALIKAKNEKRHTPAREQKVRALLKTKDVTSGGALAMVTEWGVIAALAAAGGHSPSVVVNPNLTWNGKPYAELKGAERVELKRDNPEMFEAMRNEWIAAGEPLA